MAWLNNDCEKPQNFFVKCSQELPHHQYPPQDSKSVQSHWMGWTFLELLHMSTYTFLLYVFFFAKTLPIIGTSFSFPSSTTTYAIIS